MSTVVGYVADVRAMHKSCDPEYEYELIMAGLRKQMSGTLRKPALEQKQLTGMLLMMDPTRARDARDGCLYTMLWGTWVRTDSVLPKKAAEFSPTRHMCLKDVKLVRRNGKQGVMWGMHHQKQDQTGELKDPSGRDWVVTAAGSERHGSLTWLQALKGHLVQQRKVAPSAPLFLQMQDGKFVGLALCYSHALADFQARLRAVIGDLAARGMGMHSFRRGGATAALRAGVPEEFIKLQGRWKSDAWRLYVRMGVEDALSITYGIST
jgi:integrase